nr:hypothetical protein [Kibdelosporangium sp. MJ126-NF4]CEL19376.1 hypothetical protein [Kibdelosporangium sp. MJ126-NF4]CTQ94825.1 hypothetical protein [Kibdelosporangium sp. MJ126-NF4]
MNPLPRHQALLGVDVIGSARNPGHYLEALKTTTDTMLRTALTDTGIGPIPAADWESTGDGALLTLPSSDLGALFDAASRLETLAAQHNRWNKPDVRLRIAVHVGPVGPRSGYYEPKIAHSRLLNAPIFKQVVEQCLAERPADTVNTGLIVSDDAYRAVFGGDHTNLVNKADFASVVVADKEFEQPAWIRVPGFEAKSLTSFTKPEPRTQPTAGMTMHNTISGSDNGVVQAREISGNITFGSGR